MSAQMTNHDIMNQPKNSPFEFDRKTVTKNCISIDVFNRKW